MTLKFDKAGRVILPKPIRDRIGLHAGGDVEVLETPGGIILKAAQHRPSMVKPSVVKIDGLRVHTGKCPPDSTSRKPSGMFAKNESGTWRVREGLTDQPTSPGPSHLV